MSFSDYVITVCLIGAAIGILFMLFCLLCEWVNKVTKGWLEKTILKFFLDE